MANTPTRSEIAAQQGHSAGVLAVGRPLTVALLGAPYVGKSTLFNLLAGFSQHTVTWPGTTVELRTGSPHWNEQTVQLFDLPAVYSLTANSPDEQVARDFILQQKPDVLVVLITAVNLERTLYLVSEAMELSSQIVVAVNMMDVAEKSGILLEERVLQAALGVPVVAMTASKGKGVSELLAAVSEVATEPSTYTPRLPEMEPALETLVLHVASLLDEPGVGLIPGPVAGPEAVGGRPGCAPSGSAKPTGG